MKHTKRYFSVIALAVVFFTAHPNVDSRGDAGPDPIYACLNREGQVRVIPPDTGCYPNESAVEWGGRRED